MTHTLTQRETAHQRRLLEQLAEAQARRDDAMAEMMGFAHSLGLSGHPDFPLPPISNGAERQLETK